MTQKKRKSIPIRGKKRLLGEISLLSDIITELSSGELTQKPFLNHMALHSLPRLEAVSRNTTPDLDPVISPL